MSTVRISVTVDGQQHDSEVEPGTLLVHHLRDTLGRVGTPVGCDTSNCGACTVLLDGKSVKSCAACSPSRPTDTPSPRSRASRTASWHPVQTAFKE